MRAVPQQRPPSGEASSRSSHRFSSIGAWISIPWGRLCPSMRMSTSSIRAALARGCSCRAGNVRRTPWSNRS